MGERGGSAQNRGGINQESSKNGFGLLSFAFGLGFQIGRAASTTGEMASDRLVSCWGHAGNFSSGHASQTIQDVLTRWLRCLQSKRFTRWPYSSCFGDICATRWNQSALIIRARGLLYPMGHPSHARTHGDGGPSSVGECSVWLRSSVQISSTEVPSRYLRNLPRSLSLYPCVQMLQVLPPVRTGQKFFSLLGFCICPWVCRDGGC